MTQANPIEGAERELYLQHVSQFVGPIGGIISIAPVAPGLPPIDLVHVVPTEAKPWHVVVTLGMSGTAMATPESLPDEPRFAELVIGLPPDWPLEGPAMARPAARWPLRLLATLASFPAASGQWLSVGHTIPNGQPPQPYVEGVGFCCAMLAPPITLLPEFRTLRCTADKEVVFYGVVPLFEREMELKVAEGTRALLDRFDQHEVCEIVDVHRRSVAGTLIEMLDDRND